MDGGGGREVGMSLNSELKVPKWREPDFLGGRAISSHVFEMRVLIKDYFHVSNDFKNTHQVMNI